MRTTPLRSDLDIGSMVEVHSYKQKTKYGIIRWLGFVPYSAKKLAGLELVSYVGMTPTCNQGHVLSVQFKLLNNSIQSVFLIQKCMLPFSQEEEMDACTDGTFMGKRYFTCPNRRGFFVHLHNCFPDSRFNKNSMQNAEKKPSTQGNLH